MTIASIRCTSARPLYHRGGLVFGPRRSGDQVGIATALLAELTAAKLAALLADPVVDVMISIGDGRYVEISDEVRAADEAQLGVWMDVLAKLDHRIEPFGVDEGVVLGLSEGTRAAIDEFVTYGGAQGLAILPGDGIGELAASVVAAGDQQLADRLNVEASRGDDDIDPPGATAAPPSPDVADQTVAATGSAAPPPKSKTVPK